MSSEEFDEIEKKLKELETQINLFADSVEHFGVDTNKTRQQIKSEKDKIRSDLKFANAMIKGADEDDLQLETWKIKINELQGAYDSACTDFDQKVNSTGSAALIDSSAPAPKQPKTEEDMLELGKKIQAETEDSLQRTAQMSSETVSVAQKTAVQLRSQTEQMNRIEDSLVELDSDIDRGKAVLRRMFRRVWSDKLLVVLLLLMVLGIAGVLIASGIINSKKKNK
ncbi:putative plant SNARE (NPSN) [Monocercomonoides exilis]|uniref:putative plant SNARE (NPSN) n=1 Tax=Monocercomonoides exilis TaxID=2049356 RepID=UPI00355AA97A|nr:putative plant SNARE (NPSN) [Monocercomonoides exilis]|eukprot:MONOS_6132.1-p1 / transcript=MONOS_6132.1 / gene=MONOS_6132 / organism=Monocercomonoides_exilis_PA203 / gene_product= Novel plant SNARE (NPSN) / transcript_product= Novel plant SNARE (NPSN) / location=Mono_scaffold00189:43788-44768(+) / protein_length=225 / sequence_SO=supercontig / SO=protein_coding / is_pseudo=false